jgi:hypothetical protein
MIGQALRIEIEAFTSHRDDIPIFRAAARGEITLAMARSYVANMGYLVSFTPKFLKRARDRARVIGDAPLAEFFGNKIKEEAGHGVWAERDLEKLDVEQSKRDSGIIDVPHLAQAVHELTEWTAKTIDEHPALYLSYIAFAEYMTVILGPSWLKLLEERCGIPRSSMTVIDNHVELDREHAEEAFALIDDFVTDPKMLGPMRATLARAMAHFNALGAEIVAMSDSTKTKVA